MSDEQAALQSFCIANNIEEISPEDDIYKYDVDTHRAAVDAAAWTEIPHYFKKVKMSALALLKMVMHARSGKTIEVMGLMQGKIDGDTMIIMDAFALPVDGCETRVSAQEEAYAYMFSYIELIKKVGRLENVIGWYHSHPGYGVWLSGIDVSTQRLNQQAQDPFLAVVVDPTRTCTSGKVEIGAFRCYPDGYKPPDAAASEYQTIPLDKIEDFGVHAKSYYQLEISYFKSSLDRRLLELLWNKYWVNTLSASALVANAGYVSGQLMDLASKLKDAGGKLGQMQNQSSFMGPDSRKGETSEDSALAKCSRDAVKTTIEVVNDVTSQVLKDLIFNQAVKR
eukprot:m.985851 g.985851  ORF g.985851 m.985851 type:complete len:338 (+) comp23986_c2_seq1:428-1441(+)